MLCSVITLLYGCSGEKASGNWPTPPSFSAETPPKHIYLIVLDTLRADHLGCYGYARNTSPTIDTLAKEGLVFERAYAPSSFTRESVSALLTGYYPSQSPWGAGWYASPDPTIKGLPQLLQAQGYATGLFTTSPVVGRAEFFPGFTETEGFVSQYDLSLQADKVTDRAIQFMQRHAGEQTFLYLHYMDPHAPYAPPDAQYLRFAQERYPTPISMTEDVRSNLKSLLAEGFGPGEARYEDMLLRYDAEIAFVDASLNRLLTTLHAQGNLENSILIFTSDHGEEFMEHGFVDHAWTLYPESIHIPLILWAPHRIAPARSDTVVSLVDLLPTIMQFTGETLAPSRSGQALFHWQDAQWTPILSERAVLSELLIQSRTISRSIIDADYQYIAAQQWRSPLECSEMMRTLRENRAALLAGRQSPLDIWGPVTHEALYHLQRDPGAQQDLSGQVPDHLQRLQESYKRFFEQRVEQQPLPVKAQRIETDMTTEHAEAIAAIGYL